MVTISKTNCGDNMWNLNWVVISSEKELKKNIVLDCGNNATLSKYWFRFLPYTASQHFYEHCTNIISKQEGTGSSPNLV